MRTYQGRDYYSLLETASRLEVSKAMIARLVQRGEFDGVMRGAQRTLWIPAAAVHEWKKHNPTKSSLLPVDETGRRESK